MSELPKVQARSYCDHDRTDATPCRLSGGFGVKARQLKCDARTHEFVAWTRWLDEAAKLSGRFNRELEGDDPFSYNETASVSLLTAASARAGFLALAEFATTKKTAHNRRFRSPGRSDLWMMSDRRSWAFEFKQITNGPVTRDRLRSKMSQAILCARCILKTEADVAVAGLIVPIFFVDDEKVGDVRARLNAFALECQYAWVISSQTDPAVPESERDPEIYLFFRTVTPRAAA